MEKINLNGHTFNLATDADKASTPEGTVFCMLRVVDCDPKLGSLELKLRRLKIPCEQCAELCWFDPLSFPGLPAHVEWLCAQCVLLRAEAEEAQELKIQTTNSLPPVWLRRPPSNN